MSATKSISLLLLTSMILAVCCGTTQAQEESAGIEFFDKAMQRKLNAERMSDLDDVVALCEAALDAGLDEGNADFCRDLMVATHYEKASRLSRSLREGKLDRNWVQRRAVALTELEAAIKAQPKHAESHLLKAELYGLPGGDQKIGLAAAEKAVELSAADSSQLSRALTTRASYLRDEIDNMLNDLDNAIDADGTNLDARRLRGAARLKAGKINESVEDFLYVIKNDEDDVRSVEVATTILLQNKDFNKAREVINKVIEAKPTSALGYTLRSNVALAEEKYDDAEKDLSKAIELEPTDIRALFSRSQLYAVQQEFKEAMADADRAIEIDPGREDVRLFRSRVATQSGDYVQALMDLRYIQRRQPENLPLQMQIAMIYLADERPLRAIEVYEQILETEPNYVEAVRGRADALLGTGDHSKAIDAYEATLKIEPDDSGSLNNLAWVLATSTFDKLRNGARSIELATKACELTEFKQAHIISTLAAGYAETGDWENALKWSTKAVELGTGQVKEQLAQELESYKKKTAWRERQTIEDPSLLDTDLEIGGDAPKPVESAKSDTEN